MKFPLCKSIDDIEVSSSGEIKLPFQTMTKAGNIFIGVPNNYEELCEKHYLFRAVNKFFERGIYHSHQLDRSYTCKLKLGASEELFLKGFMLQAFSTKMEKLPDSKTPLYHGILSAQKYIITAKENIDISLFKQSNAKQAIGYILGDVYGKDYPVEKKIIDKLIHLLRTEKYSGSIQSYLIPWNEVVKAKGLNVDISSETLEEDEKSFLKVLIEESKLKAEAANFQKIVSLDDVIAFQSDMQKDQKSLKQIKTCVDTIVSERVVACFAPYTGAQRIKAKKMPIRTLIEAAKVDKTDFKHFNPTMVLLSVSRPRMIDFIPNDWDKNRVESYIKQVYDTLYGLVHDVNIATGLTTRYQKYLMV